MEVFSHSVYRAFGDLSQYCSKWHDDCKASAIQLTHTIMEFFLKVQDGYFNREKSIAGYLPLSINDRINRKGEEEAWASHVCHGRVYRRRLTKNQHFLNFQYR